VRVITQKYLDHQQSITADGVVERCGHGSPLGSGAHHLPRAEDQSRGAGLSYSHDYSSKTLRGRYHGKIG